MARMRRHRWTRLWRMARDGQQVEARGAWRVRATVICHRYDSGTYVLARMRVARDEVHASAGIVWGMSVHIEWYRPLVETWGPPTR